MLMDFRAGEGQQENGEMEKIITGIHFQDFWRKCGSSENWSDPDTDLINKKNTNLIRYLK